MLHMTAVAIVIDSFTDKYKSRSIFPHHNRLALYWPIVNRMRVFVREGLKW